VIGAVKAKQIKNGAVVGQFKTGEEYGAVLNKGSPNLAAINKVIDTLKSEGFMDQLFKRYFADPTDVPVVSSPGPAALGQFFDTFLNWERLSESLPQVLRGFTTNLSLMMVAEVFALVWGLVLALLRSSQSRAAAPARWLATGYVDLFRALPGLIVIYMVGFGLPLAGVPWVSDWSLFQLAVLALTLVYGAYVAEVYRVGIESIHRSQTAAARSLGLSQAKTMRFVILPQALRRVVPPLLNDFIGLQKDTAFIGIIGVLDGFRRAQIYAGQKFNLSSFTGLALCFVVITIPMTRFTDYLLRRDQQRMAAGRR
jgi:polar amino acid transport system permease protein